MGGSMSSVVINGDTSGAITLQAPSVAGTTTINLPATSGTATVMPTGYTLGAGNTSSFKNRIINGDMRIDQRNVGTQYTTGSGTTIYTLDRWNAIYAQTSKYTVQQNAGSVTPPAGFVNYLGVTSTSAYTAGSSDYFSVRQIIEGLNVADLGWGTANAKTVTLSFWVRSSLTGTFGGCLTNSAENRSYPFSYTVSSANTWTSVSVTIAGDTSGTWLTTNGQGIQVRFGLGAGSTFLGTSGAWAAGNFIQPTGTVSVVGTNAATWQITGVQFEVGSTATSFDYRDYGRELVMCQRYYEVQTTNQYQVIASYNTGSTNFYTSGGTFAVVKRTTPTFVGTGSGAWAITGVNLYSGSGTTTFGAANITTSTYALLQTRVAGGASPSGGQIFQFEGSTTFTFSAEL